VLTEPSGPGQEDWMTFTFKLEQADGTPVEPASITSTRHQLASGRTDLTDFRVPELPSWAKTKKRR
jgi:hypothetical protein